ncbi:MAG: AzlD domain-containing protein, partial [Steroidobacteraceae bacterium]|nr:AzlD domain-containing protein [Steroidobacteraceae bacterium]MDW8258744.1 AzlD domain-containing protein [Gammaproteobacteria bacterium]
TALSRSTLLLLAGRLKLPARVAEALRYAPACGLAAILAPELLLIDHGGATELRIFSSELGAAIVAGLVSLRGNLLIAILAGMVSYWTLTNI